jgi:hypothetical protein
MRLPLSIGRRIGMSNTRDTHTKEGSLLCKPLETILEIDSFASGSNGQVGLSKLSPIGDDKVCRRNISLITEGQRALIGRADNQFSRTFWTRVLTMT